jgi:uncharacterized DUF497 family protein
MTDDDFEWDDVKAASNLAKHGVTFHEARKVFDDTFSIDGVDEQEDEDRFYTIGMSDGRLLVVAFTFRGDVIRIISARAAESHERRKYHEGNS